MRQARRKAKFIAKTAGEMDSPRVVGNRLYKIRSVAGYGPRKQKAFAELLGFEKDSYNKWEIGEILVPVYAAVTICEWTSDGVTLDYVYRGRVDGLGRDWSFPLKEASDRPSFVAREAPRPTRPSSSSRRRG